MAHRFTTTVSCCLAFVAALTGCSARAQESAYAAGIRAAKPTAASPRDFNGVWVGPVYIPRFSNDPPYRPEALARFQAYAPQDDPGARCLPSGWPRQLASPYPFEVIQTPTMTLMYFEIGNVMRRVWTDGRSHPADEDPSYYGHSIGRWEGDVFVVDTVKINDKQFLDAAGDVKSGELHTVERWSLKDGGGALQVDITFEDPKTFTRPWTATRVFSRTADTVLEYVCQENNRNNPDQPGPLNLTSAPGPTPYAPFTGIVSDRTPGARK